MSIQSPDIREQIEKEFREKPYLLEFMKESITWSKEDISRAIELLNGCTQHTT